MTTGSRGLHVIVPLDRKLDFKAVKEFAHACAYIYCTGFPIKATLEIRKEKRGDKIFIDTLRNQYGATAVAPFAIRAKPEAPVATPLHWHEVEDKNFLTKIYYSNIFKRLERYEDPWKDFLKTRQSLRKQLEELVRKGSL